MNETATCPHCGQHEIVIGANRYFNRGWPATCRACGALAYDRPHGAVTTLLFLFDLLAAPLLVLVWVLFPGTFSFVALSSIPFLILYWWRQRGRPQLSRQFRPITADGSRLSRRLTYLAILVAAAAVGVFLIVAFRRQ